MSNNFICRISGKLYIWQMKSDIRPDTGEQKIPCLPDFQSLVYFPDRRTEFVDLDPQIV